MMNTLPWGILLAASAFLTGAMWIISEFEDQAKDGLITFGGTAFVTVQIAAPTDTPPTQKGR